MKEKPRVWAVGSEVPLSVLRDLGGWWGSYQDWSVIHHTWHPRWSWRWRKPVEKGRGRKRASSSLGKSLAFVILPEGRGITSPSHSYSFGQNSVRWPPDLPARGASPVMFPERRRKSLPQVAVNISILQRRRWVGMESKQENQSLNVSNCFISLQPSENCFWISQYISEIHILLTKNPTMAKFELKKG